MVLQTFKVTQSSVDGLFNTVYLSFPYDMLRYDRCWPSSENDSSLLDFKVADRIIELNRYSSNKNDQPHFARWKSFGWEIIEGSLISKKI